ncbi:hypothetical protein DFQ27_005962 [Actinomortierella ambigua]|uniref:SUI1 domain-containing protein n=1 Tax=Actinomortierella ambigua TaxID=1343610 RepID=A0A9P6PXP8_9FUNG|nr:hypothetical protein DFQ27_005962 [Actinomortierella ambigua]
MFKKPVATIKSFSPLRSSDRRRLRDEILATYPALATKSQTTTEQQQQQQQQQQNQQQQQQQQPQEHSDAPSLQSIITPEGLQSAKFSSYIDEPGTIYTDPQGTPLWFRVRGATKKSDTVLIPSVYTLWRVPDFLPSLLTWNPVIDKLKNGADLMLPGVIVSSAIEIPVLDEGAIVAIKARGNKYPLAVGFMATPTSVLTTSRASPTAPRGKAVHILHICDDHLWTMGSKDPLPDDWASTQPVALDKDYETEGEEDDDEDDDDDNNAGHHAEETIDNNADDDQQNSAEEGEEDDKEKEIKEEAAEQETTTTTTTQTEPEKPVLTVAEVDKFLHNALLQALKFKLTEAQAKELLPMKSSILYDSYILPCRARGRASEADIKRSSWKKVAKWLKVVEKQGLIKCKEMKGELVLTAVSWQHPQLKEFAGHKTVETQQQQIKQAAAVAEASAQQGKTGGGSNTSLKVLEGYRPSGSSVIFFETIGQPLDHCYSLAELKALIATYIKEKSLADPKNQRLIVLDEVLTQALAKKGDSANRIPRDLGVERLSNNMTLFHAVLVTPTAASSSTVDQKDIKFVKGAVKPVQLLQEVRTGRKTATRISGLEHFKIDVDAFGQELQVLCASSVAITALQGASPKLNLREIMVQGPQMKRVSELLMDRGVPKKYIVTQDKTAKKK